MIDAEYVDHIYEVAAKASKIAFFVKDDEPTVIVDKGLFTELARNSRLLSMYLQRERMREGGIVVHDL